jgi:hypothetical protein
MAGGMSSANFTCCFLRARLALFNEISISQKKKKKKQTNKRSKERKKNREKLSTQNCAQPLILE